MWKWQTNSLHAQQPKQKTKLTSIDLADEMIQIAETRKKALNYDKELISHEFKVADAQDLSFIDKETIDLYLAPLCMHLVPDPEQMLKEAFRVMKKGGKCGFSVMGREVNCTFFKCFGNGMKAVGFQSPVKRSLHYLGERETLIELIKSAGFEVDFCWHADTPFDYFSFEEYMTYTNMFRVGKAFQTLSESQKEEMMKLVKEDFDTNFKGKHIPLQLESTLLVARKP